VAILPQGLYKIIEFGKKITPGLIMVMKWSIGDENNGEGAA